MSMRSLPATPHVHDHLLHQCNKVSVINCVLRPGMNRAPVLLWTISKAMAYDRCWTFADVTSIT